MLGLRSRWADLRAEYRREVDPSVDFFISERAAVTAVLRPAGRLTLRGGTEYDLAQGWWGTSDLFAGYADARLSLDAGVKRYRPYFELWTIWGAFSPIPYTSIQGSAAFSPLRALRLRLARERGVPPYVIFHDATLRELAKHKPTTAEALRHVYGVGERKAADLGAAVLEAIRRFTVPESLPSP